jgi:outer membrane receptor protein involved in Fe transport
LSISDEHLLLNQRVSLVGAIRAEFISAQPTDLPALLMPAIGLIAKPASWLDVRVNLARTARAPDMDELYLDIESVRGNPDLNPERAWVSDVAVELRPHPALVIESVLFGQRAEEQIRFVPRSAYLIQASNLGRTLTWGVEQTLAWRPASRVNIQGTYTLTRARFDTPTGTPLPNQPEHRLWARADVSLGRLSWTRWVRGRDGLHLFAQWDARSTIYLDNFARLANNPIHLARVGASLRVGAGWMVRMDAQNLFDQRSALDSFQRPLPGRTLTLALRWATPSEGSP